MSSLWVCKQNVWQRDCEGQTVKIKWRAGTVAYFDNEPDKDYWCKVILYNLGTTSSIVTDTTEKINYDNNTRKP